MLTRSAARGVRASWIEQAAERPAAPGRRSRARQSRRPPSSEVSPVPSSSWIFALNTAGDRDDQDEIEHESELDERRQPTRRGQRREIQAVLGDEEAEHLEDRGTADHRGRDAQARPGRPRRARLPACSSPNAGPAPRSAARPRARASAARAGGARWRSTAPRACAAPRTPARPGSTTALASSTAPGDQQRGRLAAGDRRSRARPATPTAARRARSRPTAVARRRRRAR